MIGSARIAPLLLAVLVASGCATRAQRGRTPLGVGAAIGLAGLLLFVSPSIVPDDDGDSLQESIDEDLSAGMARWLGTMLMSVGGAFALVDLAAWASAPATPDVLPAPKHLTHDPDACSDWYRELAREVDPARRAILRATGPSQCARPPSR